MALLPARPVDLRAQGEGVVEYSGKVACPSGRRCSTRNAVWCHSHPGFKSQRYRHCRPAPLGPGGFVMPTWRVVLPCAVWPCCLWPHGCSGRRVVCWRAGLLYVPVGGGLSACCLLPRQISGRRVACPPARRPRCELRSARRLEARPGPAGLAAASNRSGCLCVVRPGPATAHRHRGRFLRRPPPQWCLVCWRVARRRASKFNDVCQSAIPHAIPVSACRGLGSNR